MKATRTILLIAVTLVAALLLFAACGGGGDEDEEESEDTPSAEETEEADQDQEADGIDRSEPTTLYVRADGGSPEQCTGLANAAYPGSGTGQECAWDHPFRALSPDGPQRMIGGDTLIIGPGEYMMGFGAPEADQEGDNCASDYPWDCHMVAIPSGPDEGNPTRILGEGWDGDCSSPPQLWGTERVDRILDLTGSSNVEIACLEITDHSDCIEDHTGGLACQADSAPYGEWATRGIYAEDSTNVRLADLDIHGLAVTGVHAGRLTDWTVENVRIAANGYAGWDGDLGEDDNSNSGTMTFRHWTVEWNGCAETYPDGEITGCWAQDAGGYGDGVGTGATGGDWIIEDSSFLHNTSDGLDLLYHRLGGTITIRRVLSEGNAGNQIKTTGVTLIENTVAVSNCAFFEGKPFTFNVDYCRAGGNAFSFTPLGGDQITVINVTVAGEGDCLMIADPGEEGDGDGSVVVRNSIFQGHPDAGAPDEQACLEWAGDFPSDPFDIDYSVIAGVKDDVCPGAHDICLDDTGLVDPSLESFDAHLSDDSPAIDAGTSDGAPADDLDGEPRDDSPDIGAYEWR